MPKAAYVVFKGRTPGIYRSWAECEAQVKGFPGQNYLGCGTVAEAEEKWRSHTEAQGPDLADVPFYGNVTGDWYAVARGREPGIYTTWEACSSQTNGFAGSRHEKFNTREQAAQFVRENRQVAG